MNFSIKAIITSLSSILLSSFVIALLLLNSIVTMANTVSEKQFIIPNGILPNSNDPLHVDQFNNYFPSQMIYTTPLIVTQEGELNSLVLSSFKYEPSSKTISMVLDQSAKYSDGSSVTTNDIAFAIIRMLYARPEFPVIKFIKGKKTWLEQRYPLKTYPEGIIVTKNEIKIELERNLINPLYRFTMNIMSIIPKKYVDLEKNELLSKQIPSSGLYTEVSRENASLIFKKRTNLHKNNDIPNTIQFSYPKVKSILEYLNTISKDSVVFAHDLDFNQEEFITMLNKFNARRLAPAWFSGIVLNPNQSIFKNINCRKFFLSTLHSKLERYDISPRFYSRSLFTKLVPGYLKNDELKRFSLTDQEIKECRKKFNKESYTWGIRKKVAPPFLQKALKEAAGEIGISIDTDNPEIASGSHTGWESYKNKNILLHTTHSGFWPLDPIGDIQMLFTPNLHYDYQDIWSKEGFNNLISSLGKTEDPTKASLLMKKINQALYDMAIMSVFSHQSYSYISQKNDRVTDGSFSLTVPYPWQVF